MRGRCRPQVARARSDYGGSEVSGGGLLLSTPRPLSTVSEAKLYVG